MIKDYTTPLKQVKSPLRKPIKKRGTVKISTVETTPVIFKGELLRFEWVRNNLWGSGITRKVGCYHFVNMANEEELPEFATDHSFGCCYTDGDKMYVHGVRGPGGGNIIDCFVSSDLENWEQSTAITFAEDIKVYNTSVCRGPDSYIMAIEIGGTNPVVGVPFTCIFATSPDLINWTVLDMNEYSYCRDRYTACPCLRYFDGYYYIICLESAPFHRWITYIARSRDLKTYEMGEVNPIMWFDDNDKVLLYPERFTEEEKALVENAVNCNNSDFDMCTYGDKTVITYSWGNQFGKEFLALAEYEGTEEEFVKSFFLSEE